MGIVYNLLRLTREEKDEFIRTAPNVKQIFARDGIDEQTGKPLGADDFANAAIIIGNAAPQALVNAQGLRWLQTWSAGAEQYAAPGVLPPQTLLTCATGAYGQSVSEHIFAVMLSLIKRLPTYRDNQNAAKWEDLGQVWSLCGAKVLICGAGDLGSSFALLCRSMGAYTIGLRRDASKPADGIDTMYGMDKLDSLLGSADVVALFLPHNEQSAGLMNEKRLRSMKRNAVLLNAGRGTAVDCDALARVLGEGLLWGAGLDVTSPEPLPPDHPLWHEKRALITPHVAGNYHLSVTAGRITEIALDNFKRYFGGQMLKNIVKH